VHQTIVSRAERGDLSALSIATLQRLFGILEGELLVSVRWRGGELDRLLDRAHAGLVERITALPTRLGWQVHPEVTFSRFGERGSIDFLGWDPETRSAVIGEVKSDVTGIEETLRRHDVKVRLGPEIVRERFGVDPRTVSKLLVLPETTSARRRVATHSATFGRAYPDRGLALRHALRDRDRPFAGIMFEAASPEARRPRRIPAGPGESDAERAA